MRRNDRGKKKKAETRNFWQSYSDMMAALLLVFILALVGGMLSARKSIDQKESELVAAMSENAQLHTEVQDQSEQLSDLEKLQRENASLYETVTNLIIDKTKKDNKIKELESEKKDADEKIKDLDAKLTDANGKVETLSDDLAKANENIKELVNGIKALQTMYGEQSSELSEAQDGLAVARSQVAGVKAQLEKMLQVREKLVTKLSEEFSDMNVTVDEKGSISFESTLLFDVNKSNLKEPGKEFLDTFMPRYVDLLLDDDFLGNVSEIIIEGHTDTDGSYMHNLELSQERAYAVAAYFLGETGPGAKLFDEERRETLRQIVTANGRSFSEPVLDEDGNIDKEASRRVEIEFRLKDEDMVQMMRDALANGTDVNELSSEAFSAISPETEKSEINQETMSKEKLDELGLEEYNLEDWQVGADHLTKESEG